MLKRKLTTGSLVRESKPGLGVGEVLALHHHLLFDRQFARLIGLVELFDIAGRGAGLADKAEFQLGGGADDFLEAVGVLQARHFDQHAVGALALDVRLGGAQTVDAAVQHLDGLLHRALHLVVDGGVGDGQPHQPVVVGDVQPRARRIGGERHELRQLGLDAVEILGVGETNLHAARGDADAAGHPDLFLAQQPAQVVAQVLRHGFHDIGAIDLIEEMRAALQVEAEHDALRLQPRRQDRGELRPVFRPDHAGNADRMAISVAARVRMVFQRGNRSMIG